MELSWVIYVLIGLHVVSAIWATNFLDFFIYEPKHIKVKRLLSIWLLPVVGLIPVIRMRKILVEASHKRQLNKKES